MKFTTRNLPGLAEVVATIIGGPILGEMVKGLVLSNTVIKMEARYENEVYYRKGIYSNEYGDWKFKNKTVTLWVGKTRDEGYNCDLVFASGSGPERAAMYGAVKAFIQSDTTGTGPDMWFDQFEEKRATLVHNNTACGD